MWPEIEVVHSENRHELILSGNEISQRIDNGGLDKALFNLTSLNLLRISDTCLEVLPDEISKLVNLQSLLLHSNKLNNVTPKIGELSKLKMLDLSRNELKTLPDQISQLVQLMTMNLSSNQLERFPNVSQNVKLSVLDLANNKLEEFPDICHAELVNLSEVKLNGNSIPSIPSEISVLSSLKVLDLSLNRVTAIPGELSDAPKLKEINLKQNPIADKRLLKLIDQCRSKQVLDYVRAHCPRKGRADAKSGGGKKGNKKGGKTREQKTSESGEQQEPVNEATHRLIMARTTEENCPADVRITENVKSVRPHILCCTVQGVSFDEASFRKFIQMQTKLHDGLCEKRNAATIATHDLNKLAPGNLTYTARPPAELKIRPLARAGATPYTGQRLFEQLRAEAEALRKEKKRNAYSGVHRYLYLLEGKPLYPCLEDGDGKVVSFPPITNSDDTKISLDTKAMLIEVTSAASQDICRKVLDAVLQETLLLGIGGMAEDGVHHTLTIQRVKIVDPEGTMKAVYPSRADLNFENSKVRVIRD